VLKPFRVAAMVALALSVGAGVAAAEPGGAPDVTTDSCEQRTLVLSAFPAEADAVLALTALDSHPVVRADRRRFYLGTIAGKKVIVAMTGIGLVNATETAQTAFERFACATSVSVGAVVFSGVAGGGAPQHRGRGGTGALEPGPGRHVSPGRPRHARRGAGAERRPGKR
jgi:nucleoside phosphorylase